MLLPGAEELWQALVLGGGVRGGGKLSLPRDAEQAWLGLQKPLWESLCSSKMFVKKLPTSVCSKKLSL